MSNVQTAQHTPGPWIWTADGLGPEDEYGCRARGPVDVGAFVSTGYCGNPILVGADGEDIVSGGGGEYTPYHGPDRATEVANARLIAAAPDLLETLSHVLARLDLEPPESVFPCSAMRETIRAAIAKATGEA